MILNNFKLCLGKSLFGSSSNVTSVKNTSITNTKGEKIDYIYNYIFLKNCQNGGMCNSQTVASSYSDLIFGSSKQAVVANDYKLIDEIYDNIAISEQTVNISYSSNGWTITFVKTMVNLSDNVLNINEVGIKICDNNTPILIAREILPSTLVVQPNETFTLQTQITMKI